MKADKNVVNQYLKTAKGQLEGVLRMVEEDAYCVDISNQLLAVRSLIDKANRVIIEAHVKGCVRDAIEQNGGEEKIQELMDLISRL